MFLARISMYFCFAIFGFLSAFNCTYRASDRIMKEIRKKQGQRKRNSKKETE
jgi:hypothetical protein